MLQWTAKVIKSPQFTAKKQIVCNGCYAKQTTKVPGHDPTR